MSTTSPSVHLGNMLCADMYHAGCNEYIMFAAFSEPQEVYIGMLLLLLNRFPVLIEWLPPVMAADIVTLVGRFCLCLLAIACMPAFAHRSACFGNCSQVQVTIIPTNCIGCDFDPVIIIQTKLVCKDLQRVFETVTLLLAQEQRRQQQTHFDQGFKLSELLILQDE